VDAARCARPGCASCATLIGDQRKELVMSAEDAARSVLGGVRRAGRGDPLEQLARVGLIAYGIVHVLVAWLALQVAWGGSGKEADQSGALDAVARQPFGKPLLWILGVGLLALALWQSAEVLRRRADWSGSGKRRAKAVWKAVQTVATAAVYLVLGILAIRFALGSGQSSAQQQQQKTTGVFGWPGGRLLVGVVALVLIAVGARQVYQGVTKHFLDQIELAEAPSRARRVITRLGQVGFPAKGVALGVVGGLLGWAAITFDPSKSRGLDAAMRTILAAPGGRLLLTLVALGILAFGAFCFARARYPERT
jgi:hypothetical protein